LEWRTESDEEDKVGRVVGSWIESTRALSSFISEDRVVSDEERTSCESCVICKLIVSMKGSRVPGLHRLLDGAGLLVLLFPVHRQSHGDFSVVDFVVVPQH